MLASEINMINAGIISKNILHFKKEVVSFLMKKKTQVILQKWYLYHLV